MIFRISQNCKMSKERALGSFSRFITPYMRYKKIEKVESVNKKILALISNSYILKYV